MPLGMWCWVPQLPQRHCCSWIDARFVLLGWGGCKTRDVLGCRDANITLSNQILVEICHLVISWRRSCGNSICWIYPKCLFLSGNFSDTLALKFLSHGLFLGNFLDIGSITSILCSCKFLRLFRIPYLCLWSHLPLHLCFYISSVLYLAL